MAVPQGYWSDLKGQVAEWSKAHAWNACRRETVSRVRIPLCPPFPFVFNGIEMHFGRIGRVPRILRASGVPSPEAGPENW